MKPSLFLFLGIFISSQFMAQNDPCTSIQTITCGVDITFQASGLGNPNYDVDLSCSNSGSGQGGQEKIYQFTAPQAGYYQIEVLSASGATVNYGWKTPVSGCNNLSWNCINRTNSPGHIGAIYLDQNSTAYIIANAEGTQATVQQFKIHCAKNNCTSIETITCGTIIQFNALGYGDPNYDVDLSCSNSGSGQGGQEKIYQFTAPQAGYYQIEVLSAAGATVNYGWKTPVSGCNNLGWNCINRTNSPEHIGAIYLDQNSTAYILANAEGTQATVQQFKIHCAKNNCTAIETITCGSIIQFNALGYGDPNYNVDLSCSNSGSGQGGQEKIYQFTAPETGYYQIEVISASGATVNYGWKTPVSGCNNLSWNCINRTNSPEHIGAIYLDQNSTAYILANAEGTQATVQQFKIHCAKNNCTSPETITCETAMQFNALGYGDPNYDVDLSCSNSGSGQGGQEKIYQFTAPQTGYYQIEVISAAGATVNYSWKTPVSGCNNLSWYCINRTNSPEHIGAIYLDQDSTVYILANAEGTQTTVQQFKIHCAKNNCISVKPATCGSANIEFNTLGYGDPNYNVDLPCPVSGSGQGGQEQIYILQASNSESIKFDISAITGAVNIGWKYASSGCNNTSWNCVKRVTSIGMVEFSLDVNHPCSPILLMLNAESTNAVTCIFTLECDQCVSSVNNDFDINPKVLIHPNPTDGTLFLDILDGFSPNDYKYEIRNLLGELISSNQIVTANEAIDVSRLPQGSYIIEVKGKEGRVSRQFVKI